MSPNSVIDAIRSRRSVREFTDRAVANDQLGGWLEAACWAPNHRLAEPWRFIVLEHGGAKRREIAEMFRTLSYETSAQLPEPKRTAVADAAREEVLSAPALIYAYSLVDDDKLQTVAIRDVLNKRGRSRGLGFLDRRFRIRQFTTRSYACNGELLDLYRGHRMWSELKRSDIMVAARSAGRYLQINVLSDGRFVYKYLGEQHVRAREYNIVRHTLSTWNLVQAHKMDKPRGDFLDGAKLSLAGIVEPPEHRAVLHDMLRRLG